MKIEIIGEIDLKDVPPRRHTGGPGRRRPGAFVPVFKALTYLPARRAIVFRHDLSSASELGARFWSEAIRRGFKRRALRLQVRGDKAYLSWSKRVRKTLEELEG